MKYIDLTDDDTVATLHEPPPRPAQVRRPRVNAATLARRFEQRARIVQSQHPVNTAALAGTFARWHRLGAGYEDIRVAQDLFWAAFKPDGPPAWKVFIKYGEDWVDKAMA